MGGPACPFECCFQRSGVEFIPRSYVERASVLDAGVSPPRLWRSVHTQMSVRASSST